MSIRQGLLALLAEAPMYGYQLRSEFEARTGGTWPLNIGQVYTTLARLERDDLVAPAGATDDGNERWALTDDGRAELTSWWATPVSRDAPARDELAIKLALAVTVPGVDVRAVVQRQRTETLRSLQAYTRLKTREGGDDDARELAWHLVLDNLVYAAEAEIRWLDHVEARLARHASGRPPSGRTPSGHGTSTSDDEQRATTEVNR